MHLLVLFILATPLIASELEVEPVLSSAAAWSVAVGGQAAVVLLAWLRVRGLRLGTGRTGGNRAITRCERTIRRLQWATLLPHLGACFAGALPARVRETIGDLVLVDEILVILPPLLAVTGIWVVWSRTELLLRDSATIARFDRGLLPAQTPTRAELVVAHVRTQILLVLVPALLALGLIELARRALAQVEPRWLMDLAQLGAVATVLVASPWIARVVLDVVPMSPGALREKLLGVAREHRVRIGTILVWRTGLSMHNGAVIGVLPGARCVLLTDALLEDLPEPELVAVMAHEVAHLRCRHLIVGALVLAAAVAALGVLGEQLLRWAGALLPVEGLPRAEVWIQGGAMVAAVVGALLVFGWVSRRLERQADTFAVRHLSAASGESAGPPRVSELAVRTMCDALDSVSGPSGIDPRRHSWRHGSIVWRQDYLRSLVGRPLGALFIDRQVRWIVVGAVAALLGALLSDPAAWLPR